MVQKSAKPRGRPRAYDRDEALTALRNVFWRRGLAGVSLDDLTQATGLHKPSLYAAFGDKRAQYLAALDSYLAMSAEWIRAAMAEPTLEVSLQAFFRRAVDVYTQTGPGCFMVTTATPEAGSDPEISARADAAMKALDRTFRRRLEKAVAAGELPADADLAAIADLLAALNYDLAVRARAGVSAEELGAIVGRSLAFILRAAR
jgi:AcrR family transcriptional regulator